MSATGRITGYHAHVYFSSQSETLAGEFRDCLASRFDVTLGRWHHKPIGPHPSAMYLVAFAPSELAELLPWLMLNRRGLVILVHPETGDDVADHTEHALWMGGPLALDIDALRGEPKT